MRIGTITEEYINDRISKGVRDNKRELLSYRDIKIDIGTMPNAEGSAEVNMGYTKVLAGIKINAGEPMKDKPNEGNLTTSAELHPVASERYETGPPSPEAVEIARVVDRGIRAANIIDTEKLFIEEGKVWNVFVDIYVLNYDGNLFDAGALAAVSALLSARMPKYEEGKEAHEGTLGKLYTKNISTSCTFAKVADSIILDPDGNEELYAKARLTIANDEKAIRAMQKGLSGSFKTSEIDNMIDATFEKSKYLRSVIKKAVGE